MIYQIYYRVKNSNSDFKEERFLTGGKMFTNFKDVVSVKKRLQKMCSSIEYKINKKTI